MARAPSVKQKLRDFLLENIGRTISSRELAEVAAPASEWARRIRELRDEEGWPILTHHDTARLRNGEYLLESAPTGQRDGTFRRNISQKLRAEVLDRDGATCQMCGITPEEIDPKTGRRARLHLGHIVDKSLGGRDEASNLRTLCSSCNQGAKNVTGEKPSFIWLKSQIRRAARDDQRAIYEWLSEKFSD